MPADGVKGKTWGPSSGSGGGAVRHRPALPPDHSTRWKASSAPSLEKAARPQLTLPSVGTVPEGELFSE